MACQLQTRWRVNKGLANCQSTVQGLFRRSFLSSTFGRWALKEGRWAFWRWESLWYLLIGWEKFQIFCSMVFWFTFPNLVRLFILIVLKCLSYQQKAIEAEELLMENYTTKGIKTCFLWNLVGDYTLLGKVSDGKHPHRLKCRKEKLQMKLKIHSHTISMILSQSYEIEMSNRVTVEKIIYCWTTRSDCKKWFLVSHKSSHGHQHLDTQMVSLCIHCSTVDTWWHFD